MNRSNLVRFAPRKTGLLAATAAMLVGTIGNAAAAIDVTAAETKIGEAAVAGAAIGLAVLLLLVGIKVFKWVRGGM